MKPILIEPLSEQAYELLQQLEALHVLRVVQPEVPPASSQLRKWAGALAGAGPGAAEAWDKHLHEIRNEWERDI